MNTVSKTEALVMWYFEGMVRIFDFHFKFISESLDDFVLVEVKGDDDDSFIMLVPDQMELAQTYANNIKKRPLSGISFRMLTTSEWFGSFFSV